MADLWLTEKLVWCKITANCVCHGRNTESLGSKGQDKYPKRLEQRKEEWGACLAWQCGGEDGELKVEGEESVTQKEEVGETAR